MSTLLKSSLPLIFPDLVYSQVENSQRPHASICNSRKKEYYFPVCQSVVWGKPTQPPSKLIFAWFLSDGTQRETHYRVYVRSVQEDNPNTFLSLLKGHCAGVPGHNPSMQWNTVHVNHSVFPFFVSLTVLETFYQQKCHACIQTLSKYLWHCIASCGQTSLLRSTSVIFALCSAAAYRPVTSDLSSNTNSLE